MRGWKQPVLVLLSVLLLGAGFVLAACFPVFRAALYPLTAPFRSGYSSLHPDSYSPVFTTEEKPTFRFFSASHQFYRFRLYRRADLLAAEKNASERSLLTSLPYMNLPVALLKDRAVPSLFEEEGFFAPRDLNLAESRIELSHTLPADDYVAVFEARELINLANQEPARSELPFRVTDLGAIIKIDQSKTRVFAFDLVSRKVVEGAEVELYSRPSGISKNLSLITRTITGADGFVDIEFPPELKGDVNALSLLVYEIKSGKNRAYQGTYAKYGYSTPGFHIPRHSMDTYDNLFFSTYDKKEKYRAFLNFDRPLYRLGQSVNFGGQIAVSSDQGIVVSDKPVELRLKLMDSHSKEIYDGSLITREDGSFAGHFNADLVKHTGHYILNIVYPDGSAGTYWFFVDQYRKPEFMVDARALKDRYVFGDTVKMEVDCQYFFGAPVKDAEVSYRVKAIPRYPGSAAFIRSRFESQYMSPPMLVKEGKAHSDNSGMARIEFEAVRPETAFKTMSQELGLGDCDFEVEIEAIDLSRKAVSVNATTFVSCGDIKLGVKPSRYILEPGEKLQVKVDARDYSGKATGSLPVTVSLASSTSSSEDRKTSGLSDVVKLTTTTDDSGSASLELDLPRKMKAGSYSILAQAQDESGRRVGAISSVYIAGSLESWREDTVFGNSIQQPVKIELDKDEYKPGERVRALIALPASKKPVILLFSLEGPSLGLCKRLPVKGRTVVAEFDLPSQYAHGRKLSVAAVLDDHYPIRETVDIALPVSLKELDVNIESDKSTYQPGETANLEITIKDPGSRKPVAGAWCQTDIVDESLYSILSAKIPDGALQALWKHPRTAFYTSLENRVNTRFTFSDYYHPDYSKMKFFDGGGMKIADRFMNIAREGLGVGGGEIHRFYAAENDVYYGVDKNQGKVAGGSKTAFRIPVRSDFKDALAWQPHLLTDASGKARFSVKLSDDLTTWRVSTTVFDRALDFGQVHSNFRVSRDFIATLALPRFYTKGDETAITALVHNLTDSAQKVNLSLDTSEQIQLNNYEPCALNLAAGESVRHGWPATIKRAGQASLKLTARGASVNASDAVAQKIPVNDLGYRMYLSSNGILKDEMATVSLPLKLPNGADLAASSLRLELAPSLIGPVTGGYENLIQYPYGCTEQTLSRLIPSVVARRLKNELALHLSDAMEGKFDVIRTKALTKLKESQNVDGGWGWFKASKSDIYMTAQVMEGLYQMKQAGFKMIGFEGVRANGLRYLESAVQSRATLPFDSTTGTDMARAIYVLSLYGKKLNPIAKTNTFLRVDEMPPEALSYLALAFKKQGEPNLQIVYERLKLLANEDIRYTHYDHTERMLKMLDGGKGRPYTYRYTGVETTALALRAVAAVEPDDDILLERMASWLILERDQNGWNNTKCTASVLTALLEKELAQGIDRKTDFKVDLSFLSGFSKHLDFDKTIEQEERSLQLPLVSPQQSPGQKSGLVINKTGPGWLYYTSILSCMRPLSPGEQPVLKSLPEDLKLRSEFFKLTRTAVKNEECYRKTLIGPGDVLRAGELVMMRVEVDAPSSYPYVLLEAPLPSGAEVQDNTLRILDEKGKEEPAARLNWYTHKDCLDDKIAFFAERLPAGKNSFTAFLRLEMPGVFNVIPANLETMYSNKVRAHSKASLLKVK